MHAFLHCISSFGGTSYKNISDAATSSFISCCFILAFTSADIIFHKFLGFHSTLFEKRFLLQIYLFLMVSLPSPPSQPKPANIGIPVN